MEVLKPSGPYYSCCAARQEKNCKKNLLQNFLPNIETKLLTHSVVERVASLEIAESTYFGSLRSLCNYGCDVDKPSKTSVVMQRLSYPTETVSSTKIPRNRIVLSFKDSPRKPLRRRPLDGVRGMSALTNETTRPASKLS